ncbi:unnamed protein product [Urochloa decumbens]|uniref:WRKY domain-containing protein n=1 Tax=Urochloa decumbens TaxID=240449 RepID=A0ABC9AGE9_9POAL
MAASLGLVGHEAASYYYAAAAYPPPAASSCFPPELVPDNNGGAVPVMEFPSAAAAADCYFPEIMGGQAAPEYYCSPPAPAFANGGGAAENGIVNMSYVDDDGWRRSGGGRRPPPRIGFRTRSEVDVLDDGFKWRKYGKKAVKSSPNPRNYYRCSSEGCGVKKRVERDRHDTRYVITTYDGVHNHAAPGGAAHLAQSVPRPACSPPPAPWSSAPGVVGAPCDDPWWGTTQLHAAAAHSSESSY